MVRPKPVPSCFRARPRIGLAERFENSLVMLGINANPRVPDGGNQPFPIAPATHTYLAVVGELDRIPQQVQQDLFGTPLITENGA